MRPPKVGLSDVAVSEGGTELWKSGAIVERVSGITDGVETDESVVLNVGSGSYEFELTGK